VETSKLLKQAENIPVDKNLLWDMFKRILRLRLFQEEAMNQYRAAKIVGYLHANIGNEAAEVGAVSALQDIDIIIPTHRGHGLFIARGADMGKVLAELMAKNSGYCRGRAGDLHMAAPELGIMQVQAILGAQMSNAPGIALANKKLKNNKVTLCVFGDGSAGSGSFHEGINLSSIWKLPVVFLCINNGYAISFPSKVSTSVTTNAIRGISYSIPGYDIDGTDVWLVYSTLKEAVERARSGGGPSIIQANTMRCKSHEISDDASYRSKEEIAECELFDPIKINTKKIKDQGITDEEIDNATKIIRAEVKDAAKWAIAQPYITTEDYIAEVENKF
jgi:acetoin:2,6-dichlorophenolindophenol oxidoreductase subunit alpha